jgi:hypothetical protein
MTWPDAYDLLGRKPFLDGLLHHIADLASVPLDDLPAPRVLAVDASWGSGKTWVAKELLRRLITDDSSGATLIDAFRYDHHADPFAVIAAAMIEVLAPQQETRMALVKAATPVLKVAAPIAIKWALDAALDYVGLDVKDLLDKVNLKREAVDDSVDAFSDKSVDRLFESYSSTEKAQSHFIQTLSSVTGKRDKPFVIIIDELDRCRPTFALEVLERIKHLFTAEKVVFVLFWNKASLHESIRHTYGSNTNSETYLDKFVALTIPLPVTEGRFGRARRRTRYEPFIDHAIRTKYQDLAQSTDYMKELLGELSELYDASVRDIDRVLHHIRLLAFNTSAVQYDMQVYLLFLLVKDSKQFALICNLDPMALEDEHERLSRYPADHQGGALPYISAAFKYMSRLDHYRSLFKTIDANTAVLPDSDADFAREHHQNRTDTMVRLAVQFVQEQRSVRQVQKRSTS